MNSDQSHLNLNDANEISRLFDSNFCLMDHKIGSDKVKCVTTHFTAVNLHNIDIFREDGIGFRRSCRTRQHILADSIKDFLLTIPLHERSLFRQAGKQTICETGSLRLFSTSAPFSTYMSGADPRDKFSALRARISGSKLRQLVPDIDNYPDLVLKVCPGAGALMKSLIEAGLAEGRALSTSHAREYGDVLIHAVASVVLEAPEIELKRSRVHQSSHERIRESAIDFISRHLSDPELDCAAVAAHCEVSDTYLHLAFASASLKVGAYIRNMRLGLCRKDLTNPALRNSPITEIMMNWGFIDSTLFGRNYKARFGRTPREERKHLMSGQ